MGFIKRIIVVALFVLLVVAYFNYTEMPTYKGQLSLDINNCTFKALTNISIEYEGSEKKVVLPEIKPFERVIVIAPNDIFDKPTKTRVFINYNGRTTELLGEYHSLNNAKYETDISQYARVRLYRNRAKVLNKGLIDIRSYINLKPYFRVVDLN